MPDDDDPSAGQIQDIVDQAPRWRPPCEPESLLDLLAGDIRPREWLLGTVLCRGYLTVLAASGGSGKTALSIAWALSLASGRPLVGLHVHKRCRVLVLTYEDGRAEFQRRFRAACMHHDIEPADIGDWILFKSLAGENGALTLAEMGEGAMRETEASQQIGEMIERLSVDVIIMDPFIKCSSAPENDNVAVDFVARILTRLAVQHDVAILVCHHFRKAVAEAGNIDSARGARSLIDAARIACTLMPMECEEARRFGIPDDERKQLIRLDDGKANLAPLAATRWYRLAPVDIGNGTPEYPKGDSVQAVETWVPPDTWDGLDNALLNRILDDIDAGMPDGGRYSGAPNARSRAAWPVVQKHAPNKTEAQCRLIIKTWLGSGLLLKEKYQSEKRREEVSGLIVVPSKRPGAIHD